MRLDQGLVHTLRCASNNIVDVFALDAAMSQCVDEKPFHGAKSGILGRIKGVNSTIRLRDSLSLSLIARIELCISA